MSSVVIFSDSEQDMLRLFKGGGMVDHMAEKEYPDDGVQETRQSGLGFSRYSRIIKMARTPDRDEYKKTLGITALGIILLGAIGFGIMWLMTYLPAYF